MKDLRHSYLMEIQINHYKFSLLQTIKIVSGAEV